MRSKHSLTRPSPIGPFSSRVSNLSYNTNLILLNFFKKYSTLLNNNSYAETISLMRVKKPHPYLITTSCYHINTPTTSHIIMSTHGITTSTEERALKLLGQGVSAEATAAACGISVSRISQLLSDEVFSAQVAALRYEALQKHNNQDNEYDEIESALTAKFRESIPLMMRPMEILKGLQVINAQKRRGTSAPEAILEKQQVVNITLPSVIVNNFTNLEVKTNIHNQVVQVGNKDLTTMQAGTLLQAHKAVALPEKVTSDESNKTSTSSSRRKYDPTNV